MVMDKIEGIILLIVGVMVISLLIPFLLDAFNLFDWTNVTVAGETKDYSIVPKILWLGIVVGLIFVAVREFKTR